MYCVECFGANYGLFDCSCAYDPYMCRRVLVYSSQKTGASLLVDALGQFPRTVTLDLYPGKEGPEPGVLPRPMSAFQIYAREVASSHKSVA